MLNLKLALFYTVTMPYLSNVKVWHKHSRPALYRWQPLNLIKSVNNEGGVNMHE